MEIDPNVDSMEGSNNSGLETLENSSFIGKEKVSKKGIMETNDVFSIGVGGKASDDLELGRLKATDKDDSLWGKKQQEEYINKGKSEVDLYLLERAEKLNERSSLTPKIVEGYILTGNWLQATCPIAEPCVVQEHAENEDESLHLLEHYINVETEYESGVTNEG
ncbi:hypothetical protein QYF36_010055 [Acer negundo]|nr:hypothetical protein QYF36_010055 [Acer negundo]